LFACSGECVRIDCDREYTALVENKEGQQEEELVRVVAVLACDADPATEEGSPHVLLAVRWFAKTGKVDARTGLDELRLCGKGEYTSLISPHSVLRPAAVYHLCGKACQVADDGQGFVHSPAGTFVLNTFVYNLLRL
jgi:hypothetical protein